MNSCRPALLLPVLFLLSSGWFVRTSTGQERGLAAAAHSATPQERLLMEQIDQLALAGQLPEAIASLQRLVDHSEGRLVELGATQRAATISVQLYGPIAQWSQQRMQSWLLRFPDAMAATVRQGQERAIPSLEQAELQHDWRELQKVVDRYALAPATVRARLFLSDLYLDRGWTIAARQALDAPGIALRIPIFPSAADHHAKAAHSEDESPTNTEDTAALRTLTSDDSTSKTHAGDPSDSARTSDLEPDTLPWPTSWPHLHDSPAVDKLMEKSRRALRGSSDISVESLTAEVVTRTVEVAALDCSEGEFTATCAWAAAMATPLPPLEAQRITDAIARSRMWFEQQAALQTQRSRDEWLTFAGDPQRSGSARSDPVLGNWPTWSSALERMTSGAERNHAIQPPVAENLLGLVSYHPLIHRDRVYLHQLTRIVAFDLNSGKSWPAIEPPLALLDSGIAAANYLPLGYPTIGAPRGTLAIERERLFARMGPPISAWYGKRQGNADSSLSSIVSLDLAREGSMSPGYPVHLSDREFAGAEFEGCPLPVEDQLIVAVGTRDNVQLQRSVLSLDRESGAVRWRSPTLASGTVSGSEQAGLIAHQLISASGGRIFVNTNLGAVACLDQSSGKIIWSARYRRSPPAIDQPFPRPDRFRYRDLTPCLIDGTQVICAPQDCPEIFALDAVSGSLLWSTDAEAVDDATQLLGVSGDCIVVGGDRLYWLQRNSGRILAAFPAGTSVDAAGTLPSPRGYGRGVVSTERVYWPTQQELFIFDADQSRVALDGAPRIRQRISLSTHGGEGGNIVLFGDGILIAGASRIYIYGPQPRP